MRKIVLIILLMVALIVCAQLWFVDSSLWWIIFTSMMIVWWFVVLVLWWDNLVEWAHSVAIHYKIPPLIVGMTILAIGTSMPELFVNMIAAVRWETWLLLANIVGSNISNLLLIGWIASLIAPLAVKSQTLYKEIPISFWAALVLLYMISNDVFFSALPNMVSRTEWFFLLFLFVLFMIQLLSLIKNWEVDMGADEVADHSVLHSLWLILLWGAWLYVWWEALVTYSVELAKLFNVSTVLIGASIVAIWTSIPELATSVIASLKKHTDMAIWNIVGSNIFNILWVWGITATISPIKVQWPLTTDISFLMIATILIFIIVVCRKDRTIHKQTWILMIILYICYLVFLIHRW